MKGIVHWFADNPIAANLLMLLIMIGGFTSIPVLDKQVFPDVEPFSITVNQPYPGAGPSEVETQICVRIENAIHDLEGIKKIQSLARQSQCSVTITSKPDYDVQHLLASVKTQVDAISTFPADAEKAVVTLNTISHLEVALALYGDIGENAMKVLGEQLRDEMVLLDYVDTVQLSDSRNHEVSIEVSELDLRRYGLSFDDVVRAIDSSSVDLSAGLLRTGQGDIQLQARGQAYQHNDFENILLLSKRDGTQVLLGDVANIVDGFTNQKIYTKFDGRPSLSLLVSTNSHPNVVRTSRVVNKYLKEAKTRLPPGVELDILYDSADAFKSRIETLFNNAVGGLLLVFLVLMLFLRPKLAMWVSVGIAVAFLGTLWILPMTGTSLNMLSLFAFLMVIGIVVDDAIVVGESVHRYQSDGYKGVRSAVLGTNSVLKPVMFAVISTMVFFAPLLILPGDQASAAISIPVVVLLALSFSLIESLLILPAHLAHMKPEKTSTQPWLQKIERMRQACAKGLNLCGA